MKIQDDALKKLYQGYIASKIPHNRKNCPSPMDLFSSFKCSTSKRIKREIIAHITECSFCKEEFELLLELQRYQISSIYITSEIPAKILLSDNSHISSFKRSPFWRYAYILLGLVLITSSFFLILQNKQMSEVLRTREARILLFSPTRTYPLHNPLIFRWQKQSAAQYYMLELFDDTLLPIWTSQEIFDVHIQLPNEVITQLQIGKSYYWMITAYSGTEIIVESDLMSFLVLDK